MPVNTEITGWFNKKRIKHMKKEDEEEDNGFWMAAGLSKMALNPVFTRV